MIGNPFAASASSGRHVRGNPPGLSQLSYRSATYTTVLQDLVNYLAVHYDPSGTIPMLRLDTGPQENWGLGLLQAWAMVIDVLTFYQERIANEGYLRTATETRSVIELVRLIGYELRPAVSASTFLAFTVRKNAGPSGLPPRSVIPQGTMVQSVPTQGRQVLSFPGAGQSAAPPQLPQVFETSEQFEARVEWNRLIPAITPDPPDRTFWPEATSLRLYGTKTALHTGDMILIVGDDPSYTDQNRPWFCAALTKVEPDAKHGYTQITWGNDTRGSAGVALIKNHAVFALRQKAKLYTYTRGGVRFSPLDAADWTPSCIGLSNSTIYALTVHSTGSLFAATDDGVFRSTDNGDTWQSASTGLMRTKIRAFLVGDEGRLYAGSTAGNLFNSVDNGTTWQAITPKRKLRTGLRALLFGSGLPMRSLPKTTVRALASYTRRNATHLAAATDNGVFTSADGGGTWQQSPTDVSRTGTSKRGTAWVFAAPARNKPPLVGMDTGVFPVVGSISSNERRKLWEPWLIVSLVVLVLSLLVLLAGIVAGIPAIVVWLARTFTTPFAYLSDYLPAFEQLFTGVLWYILLILCGCALVLLILRWWAIRSGHGNGLPVKPFHALTYLPNGQLLASCSDGIFRSTNHGRHWTKLEHSPAVQTFCLGAQNELFAGTSDGQVLRSQDGGNIWTPFSQNLQLASVQALTVATGGLFAAGQPTSTDPDDQWTRFQLQRGQVDLDKLYPQVASGSWLVLNLANNSALFKAIGAGASPGKDFKKGKDITSVQVDGGTNGEKLAAFARSATAALVQSERLPLFDDRPLQKDSIPCDSFIPGLAPGQELSVSGKRIRFRVVGKLTTPLELVSADGLQRATFTMDDTLVVITPPVPASVGGYTWLLRDRNGFVGSFTAPLEAISYEPAGDQDETVSELVMVSAVQQQDTTTMTLDSGHALATMYDRSSVTICANVVPATHGQTIQNEVLGGVDVRRDVRTFTLKQKPLSYLSSIAAEEDQPAALTVLVNGIAWNRVSSFFGLSSDQRAYIVRHDSAGNTSVTFGDGEHGAHLPGGQEHITATYRVGSGTAGNIAAGSLTVLRSRPPGVQQVTNPVPATGGADAESMDDARVNAPLHIQCMERIVSLDDYTYFVRIFAGVSKVQVRQLWKGRRHIVFITVAGDQGQEVATDALLNAINAAVSMPARPVYVELYEPLYFQLEASLVIEPSYIPLADTVIEQVRSALVAAFSFSRRELGQSLALSEVVTVAQSVTGVTAVKMKSLYLKGQDTSLNASLAALSGRFAAKTLRPAQLLLINAEDSQGIVLQREDA